MTLKLCGHLQEPSFLCFLGKDRKIHATRWWIPVVLYSKCEKVLFHYILSWFSNYAIEIELIFFSTYGCKQENQITQILVCGSVFELVCI